MEMIGPAFVVLHLHFLRNANDGNRVRVLTGLVPEAFFVLLQVGENDQIGILLGENILEQGFTARKTGSVAVLPFSIFGVAPCFGPRDLAACVPNATEWISRAR